MPHSAVNVFEADVVVSVLPGASRKPMEFPQRMPHAELVGDSQARP